MKAEGEPEAQEERVGKFTWTDALLLTALLAISAFLAFCLFPAQT